MKIKYCKRCGKEKDIKEFRRGKKGWFTGAECISCQKIRLSMRKIFMKMKIIEHYTNGVMKCQCPGCNESNIEFLTIDHINGGGTKHRKKLGTWASNFYRWIWSNNFPGGFRILCSNCNSSLGTHGYCPHDSPSKYPTLTELPDMNIKFDTKDKAWNAKLTNSEIQECIRLYKSGTPIYQIAKANKVSTSGIKHHLKKNGIWRKGEIGGKH